MANSSFAPLMAKLAEITPIQDIGRVTGTAQGTVLVSGLSNRAVLGDRVTIQTSAGGCLTGEVLRLDRPALAVLLGEQGQGVSLGDKVLLERNHGFRPDRSWIGRVIDPNGQPLDGLPLIQGDQPCPLHRDPPPATFRRGLGRRLETGLRVLNTLLPLARGQRIGLFSGSGVGKSTLMGQLAVNLDADVTVIALVGERGREVGEFVHRTLGRAGMARAVVISATSDQSPLLKRRAAWAALATAEYFRDQGLHVALLFDSLTRFAEAHREVALAAGESASMRGYPPSVTQQIMALCERAGPGGDATGDITAVFCVLVAGSDMDEPIADITRGVLDGHIILERKIAERGRFPAIDILRSVSRCLPHVASESENDQIAEARRMLGAYESSELMIKAGLYVSGSDPLVDQAINLWPLLDHFASEPEVNDIPASFEMLKKCLSSNISNGKGGSTSSDSESTNIVG